MENKYSIYYATEYGGKQKLWSEGIDMETVQHQIKAIFDEGKAVSIRVEQDYTPE